MHKQEFRGLVAAMLLGDGSLSCIYNKHRKGQDKKDLTGVGVVLHVCHAEGQKDLLLWKVKELNRIFEQKKLTRRCRVNYYTSKTTRQRFSQFGLCWTKYFRTLYPKIYKIVQGKRRKKIQWLLKQIYNDKHLAIWFMDDGCEVRQLRVDKQGVKYISSISYKLHINGFTFGEANIMKEWFESNYKVSPTILKVKGMHGKLGPVLYFKAKDTRTLWPHIRVYIKQIPSMRHKFRGSLEKYPFGI